MRAKEITTPINRVRAKQSHQNWTERQLYDLKRQESDQSQFDSVTEKAIR
jgi:hypothetical protein